MGMFVNEVNELVEENVEAEMKEMIAKTKERLIKRIEEIETYQDLNAFLTACGLKWLLILAAGAKNKRGGDDGRSSDSARP